MTEIQELKASQESGQGTDAASAPQTPGLTVEQMRAEIARSASLSQAASVLRGADEFKHADPGLFDRALEYDSPEDFRAAVELSHRERAALIEIGRNSALEEVRAGGGAVPPATPTDSGSTAPATGLPTLEQLNAMPQDEYERFYAKHGQEVIESIWRSATT